MDRHKKMGLVKMYMYCYAQNKYLHRHWYLCSVMCFLTSFFSLSSFLVRVVVRSMEKESKLFLVWSHASYRKQSFSRMKVSTYAFFCCCFFFPTRRPNESEKNWRLAKAASNILPGPNGIVHTTGIFVWYVHESICSIQESTRNHTTQQQHHEKLQCA